MTTTTREQFVERTTRSSAACASSSNVQSLRGPPTLTSSPELPALRTGLLRAAALYAAFSFGVLFQRASSEVGADGRGGPAGGDGTYGFPFAPDERTEDNAASKEAVASWGSRLEEHQKRRRTSDGGEAGDDGTSDNGHSGRDVEVDVVVTADDAVWSEIRKDMFDEYRYCRFNLFHEPELNLQRVYLKDGATTKEGYWRRQLRREEDEKGKKDAPKFMKKRKERRKKKEEEREGRSLRKKEGKEREGGDNDKDPAAIADEERFAKRSGITYLHVGKAGGSTMSCHIRSAFKDAHAHCDLDADEFPSDQPGGPPESALSRLADCYVHYTDNPHCYFVNKSFLVNVRNPVERIKSWYLYEHVWNMPFNHGPRAAYGPRCGALMVSSCYSTFDEMATVGLGMDRPSPVDELRVGTDLSAKECSHWAWASVQGQIPSNFHNVFNYEWYAGGVLEQDPKYVEIFVVRLEHLDQDWRTVDKMVGGTGDPLPNIDAPVNSAADKADYLPVTNKSVGEVGTANLCRALCREIQVYKRLLTRAVNLKQDDRDSSMEELRKTCPEETDIEPRTCDQ